MTTVLIRSTAHVRRLGCTRHVGRSINATGAGDLDVQQLQAPVPRPPQVFAIGLNYKAHAQEGIFSVPEEPTVFTKWPTCIVGPSHPVELPVDTDWEIELVVAISPPRPQGRRRRRDVVRRRLHRRPGPLRSGAAAQGPGTAVGPRQVAVRLRTHGPVARHPRRVRRPARSGDPQLAGRRDVADVANIDADLRHPHR